MEPHSAGVLEAYESLRKGEFRQAFERARTALHVDREDFWAWYLATVALGYLDERKEMREYLDTATELSPESAYLQYLHAYVALWDSNLERALWLWSELVSEKEGWLARELVEKARKEKPLEQMAKQGRIADFIILPDFLHSVGEAAREREQQRAEEDISAVEQPVEELYSEPEVAAEERYPEPEPVPEELYEPFEEPTERVAPAPPPETKPVEPPEKTTPTTVSPSAGQARPQARERPVAPLAWALVTVAFIGFAAAYLISQTPEEVAQAPSVDWRKLTINEWANVVPAGKGVQFKYEQRDALIKDFELAKKKLRQGQINQCRYLLQRIILSNADFKSKEKSKVFLNFIPTPSYEDFSDRIAIPAVLKEKDFYLGSVVLWEGRLLQAREVDKGRQIRLVVAQAGRDYIVEGFLRTDQPERAILPYGEFDHSKQSNDGEARKVIVYGQFKGVIGAQNAVYLELLKVWM